MKRAIFAALLLSLLSACASIPSPRERQVHADALATAHGWTSTRIPAGDFDLVAYLPGKPSPAETLTIYIEGDGFAWVTGNTPSIDPTPRDPLGLRLALSHPVGNAAYLARPCQYVDAKHSGCAQRYWTEARFAPEVIESANKAINVLKSRFSARHIVLVGYSGGGAVAALVAVQRNDMARLVTVAGNLDHRAWTSYHRVRPLDESLNATEVADRLAKLAQTHFVGGKDKIITPELAGHWPQEIAGLNGSKLRIIPDFDHRCCWPERWSELLSQGN